MNAKMPGRPQSHNNAEQSRRAFEDRIPASWTFTTPSGDYGVDGDVEVFEKGFATGIHFLVQLKSIEKVADTPKKAIKNATRNYWAALDLPTLVVLWEAATGKMWWKWAHLIDAWGADPDNDTLTVRFEDEWSDETPSLVLDEVRAQRALKKGDASLPVLVTVTCEGAFLGERAGSFVAGARRSLGGVQGLTLQASQKRDLVLNVAFKDDFVVVRLSGTHPRYMHYPALATKGALEEVDRLAIQGNILVATYMALRSMGLGLQAYSALKAAIPHASSVSRADLIDVLMKDVIAAGDSESLLMLAQRTILDPESDIQVEASLSLITHKAQIDDTDLKLLASRFVAVAELTKQANIKYNAAQLIRDVDPTQARELYLSAADADPSYLDRAYWLRDVGATYYFEGSYPDAESYYRKAQKAGAPHVEALIGDALLRQGKYSEAVASYKKAAASDDPDAEYWLLYDVAFSYLIGRFELDIQEREISQADRMFDALSREHAGANDVEQVLALDLLSPFALWRLTESERLAGRPALPLLLGGALLLETFPPMWDEAIRAANNELPEAIAPIIGAIKRHCRDDFISFLYEDDFVDDEFRTSVIAAFDQVPDPEESFATARAYQMYDDVGDL